MAAPKTSQRAVVLQETKKTAEAKKPPLEFLEDPLDVAFEIVGKKWTVQILRESMRTDGTTRFNELLRKIEGINAKSLSARLKELEKAGMMERRIVAGTPVHTEYRLSDKGWAFRPILVAMAWYSLRWRPEDVIDQSRPPKNEKIWEAIQYYCGDNCKPSGFPGELKTHFDEKK